MAGERRDSQEERERGGGGGSYLPIYLSTWCLGTKYSSPKYLANTEDSCRDYICSRLRACSVQVPGVTHGVCVYVLRTWLAK